MFISKAIIFLLFVDLLFNEHLQSKASVGGRNKNFKKMYKLTFLAIKLRTMIGFAAT